MILDHETFYGAGDFSEYLKLMFSHFVKQFFGYFFVEHIKILLFVLIPSALIYFSKDYIEAEKKRIILISLTNIFAYLIILFSTFLLGFMETSTQYYATFYKWVCLYFYSCIFFGLMQIGFLTDKHPKLKKYSNPIKITLCIIVFFSNFNSYTVKYIKNLENFIQEQKNEKQIIYDIEKRAISSKSETLILPKSYCEYLKQNEHFWFFVYLRSVHPDFHKRKKIIFSDEIIQKENPENIRFSDLFKTKRIRTKKIFFEYRKEKSNCRECLQETIFKKQYHQNER